jgi:hypothetical protein
MGKLGEKARELINLFLLDLKAKMNWLPFMIFSKGGYA